MSASSCELTYGGGDAARVRVQRRVKRDAKRDRLLCLGWYRGATSSDSESHFDSTMLEVTIGKEVGLDTETNSYFTDSLVYVGRDSTDEEVRREYAGEDILNEESGMIG